MRILAVIGPSGSGKSTVVRALVHGGVVVVTASWTTRPRRVDEDEGAIEHCFVSDERFDALEREGFFLGVVSPFGLPYRYGLPRVVAGGDGRIPAVMTRAPLVHLLQEHYPDAVVYQVDVDLDEARRRLLAREHPGADLGTRLDGYHDECRLGRDLAHRVFDGSPSPEEVVASVEQALGEDFTLERRSGA